MIAHCLGEPTEKTTNIALFSFFFFFFFFLWYFQNKTAKYVCQAEHFLRGLSQTTLLNQPDTLSIYKQSFERNILYETPFFSA